jgi:hypothetical protein
LSRLIGILFLVCIAFYAWNRLDDAGWISHNQNTTVLIRGEWLQEEFRNCFGSLDHTGKQTALDCSKTELGSEHVMPVRYWGTSLIPRTWKNNRKSDRSPDLSNFAKRMIA